ncbi:MAG: hypothetical protein LBT50_08660 [Prevotellaceae bacterium]|jgi:hypothetical protein|nr:hypothetical protein [Prevotellaceae bacterium]
MNRFFILFFLAITIIACNKDDDFVPRAEVDKLSLQFSNEAGTDSFGIISNVKWTIEKDADWLTLSGESGSSDAIIEVGANENTITAPRSATIRVKAEGLPDIVIAVTQGKALETAGLYILSEGYYNSYTSNLAYYDMKTGQLTTNYFGQKNNDAQLGDGANDLAIYGSKLYCVVTGSDDVPGHIEIINPETGVSIKRLTIEENGVASLPRCITFYGNKAYITTYANNIARLDTASLEIDGKANLSGTYPEGICQYNGHLYVCNSGYGYGTTISVVNINSFSEIETITVPQNPLKIEATASGEIYFSTSDATWYGGEQSNLYLLNPVEKRVTNTFDIRASRIAIGKDFIYAVDIDWSDYSDHIHRINLQTKEISDISSWFEDFAMVYSVSVNPLNNDVYLTNQGQDCVVFDKDGNQKLELKTGIAITSVVVPVIK